MRILGVTKMEPDKVKCELSYEMHSCYVLRDSASGLTRAGRARAWSECRIKL
jgi:hypothetical protein